jgi:hypothetical protein
MVTSPWSAMMLAWMPMVPIDGAVAFVILQPGRSDA